MRQPEKSSRIFIINITGLKFSLETKTDKINGKQHNYNLKTEPAIFLKTIT